MQIQHISEPEFSIISALTTLEQNFRCIVIWHNEHSIKFLQLSDLKHLLQEIWQMLHHISLKRERNRKKIKTHDDRACIIYIITYLLMINVITFN